MLSLCSPHWQEASQQVLLWVSPTSVSRTGSSSLLPRLQNKKRFLFLVLGPDSFLFLFSL